jgi:hypothetical protein
MKNIISQIAAGKGRIALLACFILLPSSFCLTARGQSYSINWYKIAGGGGTSSGTTSSGGQISLSGTIGQPDASGAMTGGNYSMTGGFWSMLAVVQTSGAPALAITHSGNSVTVSWPNTGSYTLQQNSNLAAPAGWTTSGYTITTANGTNSITITPATGNLFFRLANP